MLEHNARHRCFLWFLLKAFRVTLMPDSIQKESVLLGALELD